MKVGKIKKITMYQVDFENITDDEQKMLADYGRKVITENQYFEIGVVKALQNSVETIKPVKKKRQKKISKYL